MEDERKSRRAERVLVVDDAREIREFLTHYILDPKGFEVLTAADGLEGLQLAFSQQPDLLIVDLQMPNMSGLELLRRLRLRRINIPAILITAHGSEQVAVKALRLGVRDYVIKPFVVEEMEEAISRALRESRLINERDQLIRQLEASNQQLRQRAQELNAIYSIGKSVSSSLDVNTILQRVVEAAVYLVSADHGSLMLADENGELYVRASKSSSGAVRTLNRRVQDNKAGNVMRSMQTSVLGSEVLPRAPGEKTRVDTVAYIPLVVRGESIGILSVSSQREEGKLSKRETRVLSALASLAASAIDNASLYDRIARERNQLRALIDQSKNPILVVDERNHITLANAAARSSLKLPSSDLDGISIADTELGQQLKNIIEAAEPTDGIYEDTLDLANGPRYRVSVSCIDDALRAVIMHAAS